jgi:hypothetical protein
MTNDEVHEERSATGANSASDDRAPRPSSESRDALPLGLRAGIAVASVLLGLLARTWRVRIVGREGFDAVRAVGGAVVLTLWHGEMLVALWAHRGQGVGVLVSEHKDGEIIARILGSFGSRTIRGSTSRGGTRALLALAADLKRGGVIAVTPDGPRGPRHSYAPGALLAAQRGGAPVVAIRSHADRVWRLGSWDRFEIPKPFARVTVGYAGPRFVTAGSAREAAAEVPAFIELLRDAAVKAGAPNAEPPGVVGEDDGTPG